MDNHPRILVCHPGRQHSNQLALALDEVGWLDRYLCGVPGGSHNMYHIPKLIWEKFINYSPVPLPSEIMQCNPVAPLLRRLGTITPVRKNKTTLMYYGFSLFDRWAANILKSLDSDIVIAYENAAIHTFQAARRLGKRTVLDAAAVHHGEQDRYRQPANFTEGHHRIIQNKDNEIELADLILTCSDYARESYLDAGVDPSNIYTVTLGVDLEMFSPDKTSSESTLFSILFVGPLSYHKGVDILFESIRIAAYNSREVKLLIAGPQSECYDYLKEIGDCCRVEHLGLVRQAELAEVYRSVDCLVLPSRHDSFGMVVAEALACGIPAIVSSTVGAKSLINDGVNGWVVPTGDSETLARRIEWCVDNIDSIRTMKKESRAAVIQSSWENYRKNVRDVLSEYFCLKDE